MKLQVIRKLPRDVFVACSGGVDSVALALFLKSVKKNVTLVHYNHPDDPLSKQEEEFVCDFAAEFGFRGVISSSEANIDSTGKSREVWWRENRVEFFKSLGNLVLTGHTLDDAVEWFLLTSFKGQGQYMKYDSDFSLKPFITQKKTNIIEWMKQNYPGVEWIDDPTNSDPEFNDRNYVRLNIVPHVLKVNPGFYRTIKNRIVEKTRQTK